MPRKSAVLFPLYIYPLPSAWEPLHEAISSHPNLEFVIVLNPNSGPGNDVKPDSSYAAEIPKLNAQPNVRTIGYVCLDYCKRKLSDVEEDIAKYAGWPENAGPGLAIHGVFFDETPNLYSPHVASYLDSVTRMVKESEGIVGPRLVIHNPGTIPDTGLASRAPDITAVVEESYGAYTSAHVQARLDSLGMRHYHRENSCYIVHSVPSDLQTQLVKRLCQRGSYIFVTNRHKNFYEEFGEGWKDFLDAMDHQDIDTK